MKVAVDAMGGDTAPQATVEGAYLASKEHGVRVVLVGDEDQISKELSKYPTSKLPVFIHHAPHVVAMHDSPSLVIRRMKETSIKVAIDLAKEGQVNGVVSAGNSGAAMALAMVLFKKLEGVERPAIATVHPATKGSTILIDSGGNVDCKPLHLVQFAMMGDAYAKYILGKEEPRIGVLSNGEEEGKGNDLTRDVHEILSATDLNYVGYVEGRDLNSGTVDVIVCDGFVGNVALKISEGVAEAITTFLKDRIRKSFRNKLGYLLLSNVLKELARTVDYSEYGGAPILGCEGATIICHGKSNEKAIKNAIGQAKELAGTKVPQHMMESMPKHLDYVKTKQS